MNWDRRVFGTWLCLAIVLAPANLCGVPSETLRQPREVSKSLARKRSQSRSSHYHPCSPQEYEQLQRLMVQTLSAATLDEVSEGWYGLGFDVEQIHVAGDLEGGAGLLAAHEPGHDMGSDLDVRQGVEIWFMTERANARRGWGTYAFRRHTAVPLTVQAPHTNFDQHTGEILDALVVDGEVAVAAWNNTDRAIVDVAHVSHHPFHALTHAVVSCFPEGTVVQMHGFDPAKRRTAAARQVDWILSDGTTTPSNWMLQRFLALKRAWPQTYGGLFPRDVRELGATTNQQAEQMRRDGAIRFASVEMNAALRQQLLENASLRRKFLKCWHTTLREQED